MKLYHYCYLSVISAFLLSSVAVSGQTEGSAFTLTGMGVSTPFATDYQALGINPANLDLDPKYPRSITLGFFQAGVSLYSQVLTKPELKQNLFQDDIKDFSVEQQKEYALLFANSDNAVNVDFMSIGLAVRTQKLGTFAFSIKDKASFHSSLGTQVSQLMWLGFNAPYFDSLVVKEGGGYDTIPNYQNIDAQTQASIVAGITTLANAQSLTQLLQGTKLGFSWYREFNFGWGAKIMSTDALDIHGGIGLKYILGYGMLDLVAENGTAQAYSAMSPGFKIDYGTTTTNNPSSLGDTEGMKPVGHGLGVDIGATVVYRKNFILSAAVTDIGSITWDGNVYTLRDVNITEFTNPGLESVDFLAQFNQLNGSDGLLEWQGQEKRVTKLPTTLRAGFGYDNKNRIKVGVDIVAPLSESVGSMQKAVVALGGEFSPLPWVHLQAGYTQGGNYGSKIPVGIYFTVGQQGAYEFGIASRDFVTFFRDNKPTVSTAVGVLRFRFS